MTTIRISRNKEFFEDENGKPFFYLADTVWNVFHNAEMEDWEYYLDYRKMQGFNAVQISILPIINDMSPTKGGYYPYEINGDGTWNFDRPAISYFERASQMIALASRKGFIPSLVVLWCSFVDDTWASNQNPSMVMPPTELERYLDRVLHYFDPYQPVYLISGDTDFTERSASTYQYALAKIKAHNPEALTTYHPKPGAQLDSVTVTDENLDFYMYQSGHSPHAKPQKDAEYYNSLAVRRPVVNGEPCYESIGFFKEHGRVDPFHVRKATWQSLLGGAKAGVTYGAHGLWSWHRNGDLFTSESLWGMPFDFQTALRFPGAWDVAYAKWLFELYNMHELTPRNDLLFKETDEVCVASDAYEQRIVIYSPANMRIVLNVDLSDYRIEMFELSSRNRLLPVVSCHDEKRSSIVEMHPFNSDMIIICVKHEN